MKTTFWKNKLFLGLAVATTVAAPIAVVVACGSDESTTVPTIEATAEAAAQKSIIDAPATLPTTAALPTRILFNLKAVITTLASSAKVTPAAYLAANKPDLTGAKAGNYIPVLTAEIKTAYGLAADTAFGTVEFATLATDLGIDVGKISTAFEKTIKDYDGKKTDGTTSWGALIKFWNYAFDPANNYAHLKTLLKTDNVVTDDIITNFEKVMTATKGQPSGVKKADNTDILGFGGTKNVFTTPTTGTPTTETPTTGTGTGTGTGTSSGTGTSTGSETGTGTSTGSETGTTNGSENGTPAETTKPAA